MLIWLDQNIKRIDTFSSKDNRFKSIQRWRYLYLAWAFSDKKDDEEEEVLEDAKTRKRRLNLELAKALAVLNIKPSTFHSLHYGGKQKKVKELLEKALIAR